jgi:Protein of unknown function (DUF2889)
MPLSAPVAEREHLHDRRYEFQGFLRKDGLWDIEGRMTDSKTFGFDNNFRGRIEPGEPLHDMRIRLTLDDDFVIRDIEVSTDAAPYAICPDVAPNFAVLKGVKVGPGWNKKLKELVGGVRGCTHHVEMLGAMATVAYQTMWSRGMRDRAPQEPQRRERPSIIDTCHALAANSPVVKRLWPAFYTGPGAERAS